MMPDGSYTCGEQSVRCREVEALCCTPKATVTLYVNSMLTHTYMYFLMSHWYNG